MSSSFTETWSTGVPKKRNKKVHLPAKSGRSLRDTATGHQGAILRFGFMLGGDPNQP